MSEKLGLFHTKEGKLFAGIVAEEIPVNGIWKQGLKLTLPMLINGLDDRVGDRVPEPWQSHIEDLTTALYKALQDKVIDQDEQDLIIQKCSEIINAEVDLPLLDEDEEAMAFLFLLKSIASLVKSTFKKKEVS